MSDVNAPAPSRRFGTGALLLALALGLAGGAGAAWFLRRPAPGGAAAPQPASVPANPGMPAGM